MIHGHAAIGLTFASPFFTTVIFTVVSFKWLARRALHMKQVVPPTCSCRPRARRWSRGTPPSSSPCCRSSWWSWSSWLNSSGAVRAK